MTWGRNHVQQGGQLTIHRETQPTVWTTRGIRERWEMCGNEGRGGLWGTYNDVGGHLKYQ